MKTTALLEKVWLLLWSITAMGCAMGAGTAEEVLFTSEAKHVR